MHSRDRYRCQCSHSTHSQVSRIVQSEWNVSPEENFLVFIEISLVFSINRVFFHKSHHPPRCLDNCADYGRQSHEDDRDTRSQSQNEEGLSRLFLHVTSVGFWHNLPH